MSETAHWSGEQRPLNTALLTGSISGRAGGILPATLGLAKSLGVEGVQVEVFALEDDLTARDRSAWRPLTPCTFRVWGPKGFGYAPGLLDALTRSNPHLVHTHGVWMYPSLAALLWRRRSGRPAVVSPHGMLDAWALRTSRWKKMAAKLLFERAHLRGAACLHALCEAEAEALRTCQLRTRFASFPTVWICLQTPPPAGPPGTDMSNPVAKSCCSSAASIPKKTS